MPQTVFSIDDLGVHWSMPERHKLARLVNYYVRTGRLHSVRRGIYALNEDYAPFEAAIKIAPPAYISYTTALGLHGAYFQYEEAVHLMARTSETIQLPGQRPFIYHQLKDVTLLQMRGVEKVDGYWLAGLERAICDTSYLSPGFVFEHIEAADPVELHALSAIYHNRALSARIKQLADRLEAEQEHA